MGAIIAILFNAARKFVKFFWQFSGVEEPL